jgi:hypothetical protein
MGVTALMATIDLPLKSIHGLAQTDSGGGLPFVVAFDSCGVCRLAARVRQPFAD